MFGLTWLQTLAKAPKHEQLRNGLVSVLARAGCYQPPEVGMPAKAGGSSEGRRGRGEGGEEGRPPSGRKPAGAARPRIE